MAAPTAAWPGCDGRLTEYSRGFKGGSTRPRTPILRKLIAMDIRLIDDRRVTDDAAVDADADAADDKNVGREGNERTRAED